MFETHCHTCYSADSNTKMEEMIIKAIELNFDSITITDHVDYEYPVKAWNSTLENEKEYIEELACYKKKYKDKILVLGGVETSMHPPAIAKIKKLIARTDFDQIIGSMHVYDNYDPYQKDFWLNHTRNDGMDIIYDNTLESMETFTDFDILAHFDYYFRYAPQDYVEGEETKNPNKTKMLLEALLDNKIAIEFNTKTIESAQKCGRHMEYLLTEYYKKGGEMVTIASDAHTTDRLGMYFNQAKTILSDIGFEYVYRFENREPVKVRLSDF